MQFVDLTLESKPIFEKYYSYTKDFLGWEYNFAMTFIWNAFDKTRIFDAGDMAFIETKFFGKSVFYPPLLKDKNRFIEAMNMICEECKRDGLDMDLRGLTKEQAELLDNNKYDISFKRDTSDYIYLVEDLKNLSGKRYHSKRNFVSRFARNYKYDFREYDAERDRENIIALYQKWNTTTCHETLAFEEKLIKKALDYGQALGLVIMVLYVGDALAAFSVHSKTNGLIGHTFFEKADIQFEGAYQFINQKCAEVVFDGVKYVNRQDDIGIEGLRKAKLSYYPVMLLDKYRVKRKCK